VISRHVKNVFDEGELDRSSVDLTIVNRVGEPYGLKRLVGSSS